ncbi:hypothetical protein FRC04_001530 [Tulasnella sp. 424]|nr:hypothetical protein FRC04_001530 [Tulasnella sp. 424]KAG8969076.1 hypothetical protein FRC05_001229 [Tulasnella sp. 425]
MHQVWAIEEVAAEILRLLLWSDQARMARVCRTLWATAIPLLWEKMYDISALQTFLELEEGDGCDPNHIQDDLSVPPQCKPLLSNRVALHAQLIRRVLLTVDLKAYRIVELLSRTPFRESLTRLKSLELVVEFGSEYHDATILFRAFYTPTLTHIGIFDESGVPAEPCRGFVQAITASHLPALRSLAISVGSDPLADPSYLEEALRVHQQLEEVEVQIAAPDCTQEMLETLKNLPVLRALALRLLPYLPDWSSLTPPALLVKGFPSLVSFGARTDLPTMKQLLASIGSDRMEVLKISINRREASLEDRMDEMLEGLSRFKGLKEVELRLEIDIIWEDIQPVLACGGLTRFSLISHHSKWISINRTHLNAMTQAWPKLTHLAVTGTHSIYRPETGSPQIKLADLLHLTDSLPSVRSLHISFDARRDGQEDIFAFVTAPSRGRLERLDVGFSIKDDDLDANAQLGHLLTSWWPTLREVGIPPYCQQESWNPVAQFVRSAAGVALSSLDENIEDIL